MKASVTRMTMVRMKVAQSELMFSTPILAKMAVSAANAADNKAQNTQDAIGMVVIGEELLSRSGFGAER
jgi:hypothetical protein